MKQIVHVNSSFIRGNNIDSPKVTFTDTKIEKYRENGYTKKINENNSGDGSTWYLKPDTTSSTKIKAFGSLEQITLTLANLQNHINWLAITDRYDLKLMHGLNTKYKNLFHNDLFPALGLPQQFIGEKVGINYFLDSANLLDDDGTLLRAAESDDGFQGVAVTDAAFVADN